MESLFALIFGTPGTWVTFVISFVVILKKRPLPSRETWASTALLNFPFFLHSRRNYFQSACRYPSFFVWGALVLFGVAGPGFALFAWLGGVTLNRRADARAQRVDQNNAGADGNAGNSTADQTDQQRQIQ
jgi:hypothetical protein